MSSPHKNLLLFWKKQGLKIASGATQKGIYSFEARNGISLPPDFREYLLNVNGMFQDFQNSCDQNGFAFWPLNQMRTIAEEYASKITSTNIAEKPFEYFVFADYLQWSWAYAIYLGTDPSESNHVIHVGTLQPKVVATSFTEFVNLYLNDTKELYPDPA